MNRPLNIQSLRWAAAILLLGAATGGAQTPPDQLMSLMVSGPRFTTNAPATATAEFDPPMIAPGGHSVYRVTLTALAETITRWPEKMVAAPALEVQPGTRGQIFRSTGAELQPITAFNYRVTTTNLGGYTMPAFIAEINGQPLVVPAARLEVVAGNTNLPRGRELFVECAETNVYVGQPVWVRVLMPAQDDKTIQMMSQLQLNGDGFLLGKNGSPRQIVAMRQSDGRVVPTFVYETIITPFASGPIKISAQGFTSGNSSDGPIVIRSAVVLPGGVPEYALIESAPFTLNVQPLPVEGRLPGFTGAIGKFTMETPTLSARTVQVGEPVKLNVTIQGEGNLDHLVMPPPPNTPAWRGFAATGSADGFMFTFIPLTDETAATPEIPFGYFDPDTGKYVDLSIPAMPIKVLPGKTPMDGAALANAWTTDPAAENKLMLSPLAVAAGHPVKSLRPLQLTGKFLLVEVGPILLCGGLWLWGRRRDYLQLHPEILRRRRARRALRREGRNLRRAVRAGDARAFAFSSVNALRAVSAPHFPAESQALVGGDVLTVLSTEERTGAPGALVRRLFTATDAMEFSTATSDAGGLLALQPQVERLLEQMEARL